MLAIKSNLRRIDAVVSVLLVAVPVWGAVLADTRDSSRPPGKEKLCSFNADVLQTWLPFWC